MSRLLIYLTFSVKLQLGNKTASELSELSHKFEPWKSATMNDMFMFNTALNDISLRDFLRTKKS